MVSLLLLTRLCGTQIAAEPNVFEVGYSAKLFYDVDINDARAATGVAGDIH